MPPENPAASAPASPEDLRNRPVRVAVVGTGGMGSTHVRNLSGSTEAEVTWLVDIDPDRASALADLSGARITSDIEEALSADDVDVALIALPTGLHRMGVEVAAKYGKHVFCEKPIARTNEDAQAMVETCEAAGVQLMVGHVIRFRSEYMRIKELLDAGTLGTIATARGTRLNAPVMERSPWFADIEQSGGVILDLMIHEIDTFRWYFGEVERVYAQGLGFTEWHTKRDHAMASLRFRNGVIAHLEASWAHASFRTTIEIAGEHGLVRHASDKGATLTIEPTSGITYETGLGMQSMASTLLRPTSEPPHLREIHRFIDSLRAGEPAPVDGREATRSLIVANAVLQSMQTGKPIRLQTPDR